jgi:hypothetical protein
MLHAAFVSKLARLATPQTSLGRLFTLNVSESPTIDIRKMHQNRDINIYIYIDIDI